MSTINGIGFRFIGQSDPKRDGSYIATKWFCFVLPLIPAGSYRIWPVDHKSYALGMYSSSTFQLKSVGLYLPHVVKIYGMYLAFYLFIVVADRMGSGQWHFKVSFEAGRTDSILVPLRASAQHVARHGNATAGGRFAACVAFRSAPTLGNG
jgi:hypothetical protein